MVNFSKIPPLTPQKLELHHLSHNLRDMLNSMLGFSELLLEGLDGPLTDNQRADITAIYTSTQNLQHIINSLMNLSKLEAGRLQVESEPVSLPDVINHLQTTVLPQKFPPNALTVTLPANLPPIASDRRRVEQMLTHLLDFAIEKSGGATMQLVNETQSVTIQISTGAFALSDEHLAELFSLIVYTDAVGRSRLGPGGLNLPLTYRLAEALHGSLRAERTPKNGLTFFLKLPSF
jgi:signal transduction histidine kinase